MTSDRWQVTKLTVAIQVNKRLRSRYPGFSSPPLRDDFVMLFPNLLTILTQVREQSGFFLFEHRGNIDVCIW